MEKVSPSKLLVPGLIVLLFIAAILVTYFWTRVSMLETGTSPSASPEAKGVEVEPDQLDPLTPVQADTLNIPEVTEEDHIRGALDAKLTLIEYSDLECPFCQQIHLSLQQALNEYEGQLRWVYRHFPLEQMHPQSRPSANAAECVASLGGNDAFWSFMDVTFDEGPSALSESSYISTATSLGISEEDFKSCLAAKQFDSKVTEQLQGGEQAGITGTPGSFLLDDKGNAWIIPGAVPYATIKQIIDKALAD